MTMGDPTIHITLGLLFDSVLISAVLYGAGCLQGWLYFRKHGRYDMWTIKGMVLLVLVCDTAQMMLLSAMLYNYSVIHLGDPTALRKMEKGIVMEAFFAATIAFAVQHYYCWRIWLLSRSYLIAGVISLLSSVSLVSLYVYSIIAYKFDTIQDLLKLSKLASAINSLGAITDVLISGTIIILLHRKKTPYKKTSDMINRMIFFTFNSGLPTSVCAVMNVVTLNVIPNTCAYIFFFFLLGRLYTNSLLVTLNSREYIYQGTEAHSVDSISMPPILLSTRDQMYPHTNNGSNVISFKIEESVEHGKSVDGR